MICRSCRVWTLAPEDNFCSWCAASNLQFAARLEQNDFDPAEYPPPAELVVRNESATQPIVVRAIHASLPWVKPLVAAELPATIPAGKEQSFLLDVNTFAAGSARMTDVTVEVAHAGSQSLALGLGGASGQPA